MTTLVATDTDDVYSFGGQNTVFSFRPDSQKKRRKLNQVACGALHSLFLLDAEANECNLFACGDNTHCQLGAVTRDKDSCEQPLGIEFLRGVHISCVAAGGQHTVACTATGLVYSWGSGSFGQLGLADTSNRNQPTQLSPLCFTEKVTSVAAGDYHTLFLTEHGRLFSCGQGKVGQLGHGTRDNKTVPSQVGVDNFIYIAAGGGYGCSFSFAISTSGDVFSWGNNKFGQLGFQTESMADELVPKRVTALSGMHTHKIACGWQHSLFLTLSLVTAAAAESLQPAAVTVRTSSAAARVRTQPDWALIQEKFADNFLSCIEIGDVLGTGGHGCVFKGLWQGTTSVALKELNLETTNDFFNEVTLLKSLRHPCIVQYYGLYLHNDRIFICTELVAGGSLNTFLQRERDTLTLKDLLSMAKCAAAGMVYLASNSIVHRDLACRNLLVKREVNGPTNQLTFSVKVSDFGLSERIMASRGTQRTTHFPIKWTSLEAAKTNVFTTASDVWSFGVCMYEVFTFGEEPYSELSNSNTLEVVSQGYRLPQPPLLAANAHQPGLTTLYEDLLLACWRDNPHARPSFTALHQRIAAALVSIDPAAVAASVSAVVAPGMVVYDNEQAAYARSYDVGRAPHL
eukprot:TRINITY_DN7867_c0_g1_i1.p1 TRINITY_DN7867_c0_g1~~TRINITY_DN7867_c0_g1_i1.p1  ORF type:complete len:718 (-),score=127.24 TRINITY_DN7867_c0_g1_i1:717-2597(-)